MLMKKNIRVSIIIPVYKVEKYLKDCIESVINQTYRNIEIILVDDGSPDNCPKICDNYQNKDKRIKVIHKENGGLSMARNTGLDYATGDYVWYIDSDDKIILTAVQELVDVINEYNADLICFNYKEIIEDTNDEFINKFFSNSCSKRITKLTYDEAISDNINRKNLRYEVGSKLYSIKIARKVKFPKNKLAEDFAVFSDFLKCANNIVHYDNQLYLYTRRNNSIMGCKSEKLYIDIYYNEVSYFQEINRLKLSVEDKKKAEDNYFKTLIKTYAKIDRHANNQLFNKIEDNISKIKISSLGTISKVLMILYKINHKLPILVLRKFYNNL